MSVSAIPCINLCPIEDRPFPFLFTGRFDVCNTARPSCRAVPVPAYGGSSHSLHDLQKCLCVMLSARLQQTRSRYLMQQAHEPSDLRAATQAKHSDWGEGRSHGITGQVCAKPWTVADGLVKPWTVAAHFHWGLEIQSTPRYPDEEHLSLAAFSEPAHPRWNPRPQRQCRCT